ncbi:hypothetical protein [Candidatus Raskinella chloraquaticus]|uniref:Uncharacterized protein n=1 Tax=Candidatus Raskinella chloraquaticus TaxID=1951219 RepID=A0A1W9I4U5_9HYPH|nr:MAG: hypothetical protein A4S15_03560 [Proteobacteria bacterium SG_bin8]
MRIPLKALQLRNAIIAENIRTRFITHQCARMTTPSQRKIRIDSEMARGKIKHAHRSQAREETLA